MLLAIAGVYQLGLALASQSGMVAPSHLVAAAESCTSMVVAYRRFAAAEFSGLIGRGFGDGYVLDDYRAVSTNRDSRTTVTLISPG